jgi:hypothetical protein
MSHFSTLRTKITDGQILINSINQKWKIRSVPREGRVSTSTGST